MYAIHFSTGAKLPSFLRPDGNITSLRLTDYSVQSQSLERREGSCPPRSRSLSLNPSLTPTFSSQMRGFSAVLAPCCSFSAQYDLLLTLHHKASFSPSVCVSVSARAKVWTGSINTPFCCQTILSLPGYSKKSWNIIWDKSTTFGSVMKWGMMQLSHVLHASQARDYRFKQGNESQDGITGPRKYSHLQNYWHPCATYMFLRKKTIT